MVKKTLVSKCYNNSFFYACSKEAFYFICRHTFSLLTALLRSILTNQNFLDKSIYLRLTFETHCFHGHV